MSFPIARLDLRGRPTDEPVARDVLPRAALGVDAAVEAIRPILADVRERGEPAVLDASERFDGVRPPHLRVPRQELAAALAALDPDLRTALKEAARRVRLVHEDQRRPDQSTTLAPGGTVTERWLPVRRVGLYAPAGNAVLVSSVLMNVIPAQVAGVDELVVASPPQLDHGGLPHPSILAACALLGVNEVYAAGGAQAIAMLAYGAGECRPVDMVTGPGNVYVTAAKRLVRGTVGIDSEAGVTEIAILADDTADHVHVAADLISQAEHDVLAAAILVTDSPELATAVETELETQIAATKHSERISTALSSRQSAIVLVDDLAHGLAVVDAYAAEHLEIQTRDARKWAYRVRNAGAIFVGPFSPVSLGDYAAGSNHVLPTGGCACFSSGLSVQTFLRGIHIIDYDERALAGAAPTVMALSAAEDLPAHGAAVAARSRTPAP